MRRLKFIERIVSHRMRVAYNSLLPPFSEEKEGAAVGLVLDIFRAAAEHSHLEVEFLPVPLEQMETCLADGRAVLALPIAMTRERRLKFDFTDTLLMTGGSLFVRAPQATPANLDALSGKVVATPRTGPLAAFIQRNAPEVKLVLTEDYETSLAMLAGAEVDSAALNHQTGAILANRLYPSRISTPSSMFLELPFGAAALKEQQPPVLPALNAGLAAIRADGTWDLINVLWLSK